MRYMKKLIKPFLGLQYGDEGKGKIVDVETKNNDIVARFQGGPNAGHTLEFDGIKHVLHTIPSGIFHEHVINIVGDGVIIDPVLFRKELMELEPYNIDFKKRLLISRKAHLILPTHRLLDAASEAAKGKEKIGSTLKGIGPTYMDKTGRNGIRVGNLEFDSLEEKYDSLVKKHQAIIDSYNVTLDFEYDLDDMKREFFEAIEVLKQLTFINCGEYLDEAQKAGKNILAEGAQGTLLCIDSGTYPYVTSSNTTAVGVCSGLGVPPSAVGNVNGIFKAYVTRVGSGPFITELFDEVGEKMAQVGNEFGSTTGRSRRCGWLDLPALKYAIRISDVKSLCMMKADVLADFLEVKVCVSYKDKDGNEYKRFNGMEDPSLELKPVYKTFKAWGDVKDMRSESELPEELRDYIEFIESETGVPIDTVSLGPDRTALVEMKVAV